MFINLAKIAYDGSELTLPDKKLKATWPMWL